MWWFDQAPRAHARFELGHIKDFLAAARARNMRVILSPHNFGRYRIGGKETPIGTARVPTAAFADFSNKVAAAFVGDDSIYALSLMNEPHDSDGMWKQVAQAGSMRDPAKWIMA
jgi:endoglucanase